jgi:hypothetical protein
MFPELEHIASQELWIHDVSDEPYFGRYAGVGCDMLTYTAMALR